MYIKVTADHIARGCRRMPSGCPIALAAIDAGMKQPFVTMAIVDRFDWKRYSLPWEAARQLLNFDAGGEMVPFEFEVEECADVVG